MDHSCQDIPMLLDVKHQPLNFDIYLSQVLVLPKTSVDEPAYDFQLEQDALRRVDQILERTTKKFKDTDRDQDERLQHMWDQNSILTPTTVTQDEKCNSQTRSDISSTSTKLSLFQRPAPGNQSNPTTSTSTPALIPPPSCPMETPLTPIKCFIEPNKSANANSTESDDAIRNDSNHQTNSGKPINRINPGDFEDMHNNPFDHLELQTIDELRELDLVFQASYANQASKQ